MVNVRKNILFIMVSVFCMLASLFFVGCGASDPYADVKLTASQQSISMFVGETVYIDYTIENYIEDMSNSINFSITDSSSGSSSSETAGEHVALKVVSKNSANVRVALTGISSGRSSVIATTVEGKKQFILDVIVRQYSETFEVDTTRTMYVALGEREYISKTNSEILRKEYSELLSILERACSRHSV